MTERYLAQLTNDLGHRVEPDTLAKLSDQASDLHVRDGVNLTAAVLSVVRGVPLNPAHVARIVEQTNTQAYLKLYDRCPGPDRHVSFSGGPARIFEILDAVFGGAQKVAAANQTRKTTMASNDYRRAPLRDLPPLEKQAELEASDVLLEFMGLDKRASLIAQGSRNPGGRLNLYHTVKAAMDKTAADTASLRFQLEKGAHELVKLARQAVVEGAPATDVARVLLGNQPDELATDIAQRTLSKLGLQVDPNRIPWGREITPGHPLREKAASVATLARGLLQSLETHQELSSCFAEVSRRMKG